MSTPCASLSVLTWLQALGVPALAAVGAFIAFQQMQIARTKLQHDLFERRIKVFHGLNDFLGAIAIKGQVEPTDLSSFVASTREAKFLFPAHCHGLIDEVHKKAFELQVVINRTRRQGIKQADLEKAMDREDELRTWLHEQWDKVAKVFSPHLHIGPR